MKWRKVTKTQYNILWIETLNWDSVQRGNEKGKRFKTEAVEMTAKQRISKANKPYRLYIYIYLCNVCMCPKAYELG